MADHPSLPRFDLQAHSTFSDGELEPAAVVEAAAAAGVELLALTDHDTVAGVGAALAAGALNGVTVLPAVEISAIDLDHQPPCELHILGYKIDHDQPWVREELNRYVEDRKLRTLRMAEALKDLGFALEERLLEERIAAGRSIGRVHVAQAAIAHPANRKRLEEEGIGEMGDLIRAYLVEGKPAFRIREKPTVAEAVEMIHKAGGIAVWAHPFWDFKDPAEVTSTIDRFKAVGIDGVEAFYLTHDQDQTALIVERCKQHSLLATGSTDFHGPNNSLFNRFLGFQTFGFAPVLGDLVG
jgi:predicted metal-dependent phosphoesterase TrpH